MSDSMTGKSELAKLVFGKKLTTEKPVVPLLTHAEAERFTISIEEMAEKLKKQNI